MPSGAGPVASDVRPVPVERPRRHGRAIAPGTSERRRRDLAQGGALSGSSRSWWAMAAIVTMAWSFRLLGWASFYPLVVPLIVVSLSWGLAMLLVTWIEPASPAPSRTFRVLAAGTVILCLVALAVWALLQVNLAPAYGTDELAFDQFAAHLLTHGLDPYAHSMAPAYALFHVQPNGYTFRLNGTPVTSLSYPALSFLVYVPFLLAGLSTQLAVGVNVLAWIVAIVVMFFLLPRPLRPLALVVGSLSVYIGFAVGGVTAALYVPLLAGAVYRWHRWPDKRGWRGWVSPGLLGAAVCINQVPWFAVAFLVVGVACEARQRPGGSALRTGSRYLAMTALVALVPNVPFIVWDPTAWLRGILTPITSSAVPAGQGLVDAAVYLHLGGGSLTLYSALAALALLAVLLWFVASYPRLRPVAVLLPALALLLSTRSYGSYIFGLVPAAVVGGLTTLDERPAHPRTPALRRRWRGWSLAAGVVSLSALAAGVAAVADPAPLSIAIEGISTTGQLATVDQVTVLVHNRSSRAATPHFTLNDGDAVTTFWLVHSGPSVLAPGRSATYDLLAPNFYAQVPISGGFQVVAFTTSPPTVSHSGAYLPTVDHLQLVPDAIDAPVPVGEAVTVHAELLNRLDQPIDQAGVPVSLGQIVYAQAGLEFGEAIINGANPGQTPVSALTNARGVATFIVTGTHASTNPVYFEANLVNAQHFYPYGYSDILPIRFDD